MNIELQEYIDFDSNWLNKLPQDEARKLWSDYLAHYEVSTNKEAKVIISAFIERYGLNRPETQGAWLGYAKYALKAHKTGVVYDDPNSDDNYSMWYSNQLDDAQYED